MINFQFSQGAFVFSRCHSKILLPVYLSLSLSDFSLVYCLSNFHLKKIFSYSVSRLVLHTSIHLFQPLSIDIYIFRYTHVTTPISEPGHGGLAERLPPGHRLRDVHGDPVPQLRRHDLRTGRRVSLKKQA